MDFEGLMGISFNQDIGTVTVHKKEFAINLLWSISDTREEFKKNIKIETEQVDTDLFCEFKNNDNSICYGLADSALGHTVGMPVLPAMLALALDSPFLGAWSLDENYWYVLAIDGSNTILIDKAFDNEDAAYESFCSSVNDIKWDKVICPEAWAQSQRTDDFSLNDLSRIKKVKIKCIKFKIRKIHLLGTGVLLALLVLGVTIKKNLHQPVYSVSMTNTAIKKHNVFPQVNSLLPGVFIKECRHEVQHNLALAFSAPGYSLDNSVVCNATGISFKLVRVFGSTDYIPDSLLRYIHDHAGVADLESEQGISIHFPLRGKMIGELSSEALYGHTRDKILRRFDNTFLNATVAQERACGEMSTNEVKYDRQFTCVDFEIKFNYNPEILIPLFDDYDGSVITSIIYDVTNSSWSIDGTFYEIKSNSNVDN